MPTIRLLSLAVALLWSVAARAAEPPIDNTAEHLRLSQEYYQAERYDDAIRELKAAYKTNPLPRLHCNLAQCYRKAGRYKEALDYFDLCLRTDPNLTQEDLAQIQASMRETRAEMSRPKPPPKPPEPPPKPPEVKPPLLLPETQRTPPVASGPGEPTPVYKKGWFWAVLGGGLLLVGGAIAAGVTVGTLPKEAQAPDGVPVFNF